MRHSLMALLLASFCSFAAIADEPKTSEWEAVCTTDTDVVFSVKLPQSDYTKVDKAEFPLRIWHPDGRIEDFDVILWRDGRGSFKKSGDVEEAPPAKLIEEDSPLSRVHLRVFSPEEFKKWDQSLEDLGPRNEELYEKYRKSE